MMGYDGSVRFTDSSGRHVLKRGGDDKVITLEEAQGMISAAERKAQEMGQPMNIAVMDAGRNLVAFHRMGLGWRASTSP